MTVVIVDRSFVPQPGDVHIQNPRPPVGAACIDPQHGGHRRPDPAGWLLDPSRPASPAELAALATITNEGARRAYQRAWVDSRNGCGEFPDFRDPGAVAEWAKANPHTALEIGEWDDPAPGDAACTFALRLHLRNQVARGARCVLPFNASLDSWVAAACLTLEGAAVSDEAVQRVAALAAADGVEHHAALGEWTPGTVLPTVGDDARFSGLARFVAAPIHPTAKIAALRGWIKTGQVDIDGLAPFGDADVTALGLSHAQITTGSCDILPSLTALALREREESRSACEVTLFGPGGVMVDLTYAETQAQQQLPAGVSVALVVSQMSGLSAGRGAFVVGYRYAPIVVCCSPRGDERVPADLRGPLFTVGRAANARSVAFPFAAICAALNEAEVYELSMRGHSVSGLLPGPDGKVASGWGGNPASGVLGSPKPLAGWQGSILAPEKVAEIVAQTCATAR